MRIAGLTKQSFIDWDGKLSAVVFTRGCNFRCGYCHNPSLVLPGLFRSDDEISELELFSYLSSRNHWLDGVVITGGEPTLHLDLKDFIQKIKRLGLAVKLDTNGTNPQLLQELIQEKLLDFVAMDVKSVLIQSEYEKVTMIHNTSLYKNVKESIRILKKGVVPCQFRTTIIPDIHSAEICHELNEHFSLYRYQTQSLRKETQLLEDFCLSI